MFKSTLALLAFLGLGAVGHTATILNTDSIHTLTQTVHPMAMLNWKVGDSADYSLSGGFINGTLHMFVRETTPQGFWVEQDIDVGAMGKEKIEVQYDKNNGQVLDVIANGQKQTPPNPADQQIVDSHRDHITVPKGQFDVIWAKIHNKANNQDTEMWMNPTAVPIAGMVKTIAPSQIGEITVELTDFKRN